MSPDFSNLILIALRLTAALARALSGAAAHGGAFVPIPEIYFFMAFFVPSFVVIISVLIYFLAYFAVAAVAALVMNLLAPLAGLPGAERAAVPLAVAAAAVYAYRRLAALRPRGLIAPLRRLDSESARLYGSKAASLGELRRAGLRVPFGYAVSERLFARFARANRLRPERALASEPQKLDSALEEIANNIRKGRFGIASVARLYLMYLSLTLRGGIDPPLIVRSSFVGEDSPGKLAPGQYRSYSSRGSFGMLLDTIKECWRSYFTSDAHMYRERMGVPHDHRLPVAVQIKLSAEVLGTAAAANPASGFREEIVVDISAPPEEDARELAGRGAAESLIVNAALDFPAPPADARYPFLSELTGGLRALARRSQNPPLVEWAFSRGRLYFFQLRELADLPEVKTYVAAGMVEMTPEPLCPMTVSLITASRTLDSFITAPITKYMRIPPAENLLKKINSRFYADFEALDRLQASLRPSPAQFVRFLRLCRAQAAETRGFLESFRKLLNGIEQPGLAEMSAGSLIEKLKTLNTEMQGDGVDHQATAAHITRALSAMLEKAVSAVGAPPARVRALPAYDNGCAALVRKEMLDALAAAYGAGNAARAKELLESYINKFGFLGPADEVDLTVPRIAEAPRDFERFAASLGAPEPPKKRPPSVMALLHTNHGQNLVPWDTVIFLLLHKYAKRYATLREDSRYELLRGWSLMRAILLELGKRAPFADALNSPDDIFFLQFDELETADAADGIGETASRRRLEFENDKKQPAQQVVHLGAAGNIIAARETPAETAAEVGYRGIAASPGKAAGTARWVVAPRDAARVGLGDIIIVDECSPWMSALFQRAGGAVARGGGVVSHLALAAREYGRPMLVGVHAIRGADADGRRIEIDAETGTARIAEAD